jgi:hypothetical protein
MTLAISMINTIFPLAYYIQRNTIISCIPMGHGKYHDVNIFSTNSIMLAISGSDTLQTCRHLV